MSKLLTADDLRARGIPFCRQHIHTLVKRGLFPKPIKAGAGRNQWLEDEIDQHLADRMAERDTKSAA